VPAPFSPRTDRILLLAVGAALVAVALASVVRESAPAWSREQEAVRRIVRRRLGEERAAKVPEGMQQVWIEELARVDRCVTCHSTHDWGAELADAPHPARSHPLPELMAKHPVERFGCTLCHGGQGWATEKHAAHGEVEHWGEPLLDTALARHYGLTRAELMEMRCNQCHRGDREVAGMPLLTEAKAFVAARKCSRCHVVDGVGGSVGPDLTSIGDKPAEHYHFPAGWSQARTALRWHQAHFLEPEAVVPGTRMPKFTITERQATALGLLALSWRRLTLPPAWIPPRR
jgi:hypothetical protein